MALFAVCVPAPFAPGLEGWQVLVAAMRFLSPSPAQPLHGGFFPPTRPVALLTLRALLVFTVSLSIGSAWRWIEARPSTCWLSF